MEHEIKEFEPMVWSCVCGDQFLFRMDADMHLLLRTGEQEIEQPTDITVRQLFAYLKEMLELHPEIAQDKVNVVASSENGYDSFHTGRVDYVAGFGLGVYACGRLGE